MALINIEYGSLASSEIMNKNFMYLDDKIADTSESIMTSISSILSNIATINTRLNEISENMSDSVQNLVNSIDENKTKTKILVNKACMVPHWENCSTISLSASSSYAVKSNGYILILPETAGAGDLVINGKAVAFKARASVYDNSSQLVAVPVADGDVVSTTAGLTSVYFLPVCEVSLENF